MFTRLLVRITVVTFIATALLAAPAVAAKPGPGTSTGTGQVFFPNPVASLQNQSLTDQKDANYTALQPAYRLVTLTNLDGSGFLAGAWDTIWDCGCEVRKVNGKNGGQK
jgi:hypothetical protein